MYNAHKLNDMIKNSVRVFWQLFMKKSFIDNKQKRIQ